MTEDQYVEGILSKYAINEGVAKSAAERVAPSIRRWGGDQIASLVYSGSFAKGTANSLSTDVDLFISLESSTQDNLKDIYLSLFRFGSENGWSPRQQNVSIGITCNGVKLDLVPGKIQAGYQNFHSLYRRKKDSWTQTNVKLHIDTVRASGRAREIRAIKIWRSLHRLEFPSFYLELMVIEGLKNRSRNNLGSNVLYALNFIGDHLQTQTIKDPANTNNFISDDLSSPEKNTVANEARISAREPHWENIIW